MDSRARISAKYDFAELRASTLKCLIGVNNLWAQTFEDAVCHLISFHILINIIFEMRLASVRFGLVWSECVLTTKGEKQVKCQHTGTDDTSGSVNVASNSGDAFAEICVF